MGGESQSWRKLVAQHRCVALLQGVRNADGTEGTDLHLEDLNHRPKLGHALSEGSILQLQSTRVLGAQSWGCSSCTPIEVSFSYG